ncbi:hypothetical protein CLOM621_08268 [Clostridium sp. M62/1]|nr:hypothetical protein CLOM621_08268 [Clostridium sp. M62/1]
MILSEKLQEDEINGKQSAQDGDSQPESRQQKNAEGLQCLCKPCTSSGRGIHALADQTY